jgi:hypothetical protein
MAYKTYYEFFHNRCNFSFSILKTDICDFCEESEKKLASNPNDECLLKYKVNKKKVNAHDKLKKDYISRCKNDPRVLVIEFDYAQNLPILKLKCTSQFYKCLLWQNVFNVHIHNDDSSYIYTFMESMSKKNPHTVASFLCQTLEKKMKDFPDVKQIILLSDAAGG